MKQSRNTLKKKIDGLRTRLVECQSECEAIERAPVPRDEEIENARKFIRRQSERYERTLSISGLTRPGGQVGSMTLILPNPIEGLRREQVIELAFCKLVPAAVEEMLIAKIDQHLEQHTPGLPSAERPARLEQLHQETRAIEREEEKMIRAAEDDGVEILRRSDADPLIVLGLDEAA